ncbi:MAG TPA: hypothetical protein VFN10_11865 [Thermoanaerobaculia bacterium]|nr:hypothetical protein [Thermoanaerobaculia bacterium]
MILYRKTNSFRLRRFPAPEPPFWCAGAIAPYGARRATPIALDYAALRATAAEKADVTVSENMRDELERTRTLPSPMLIDAAEQAEVVFRRGEDALAICAERRIAPLFLTSTRGALPRNAPDDTVIAIAAWPLDLDALAELFASASGRWGVAVPVIYPVSTAPDLLAPLADLAQQHGATFFAALPLDVDATARQSLAQSLDLDDDTYAMLFHADLEPVQIATERHIAALAAERSMADFIVPPRWPERSNWNGAAMLTLTASRMIAMDHDLDLAGTIARSARAVAELDKSIQRIAEAASLSIVETLDEISVEMLEEWIATGDSGFARHVNKMWRSKPLSY